MDINRCKLPIVSLFTITICFCLLLLSANAASRGITVKAKTSSGAVKEIQLYSGYHALVVGVSDYDKWPDLPYATKDAQDVARALKKMGFTVKTIFNPSSRALTKALNGLAYKYGRESDRAILFYYAGHGETEKLADGTKLGYIIPKDCPLLKDDPEGFVNNAISMKDIEAYSLRIRSKHVLMLFDSCFSGSLFSLVRAVPENITEKSTLPVRQYITAGTEDEAVPDRSMFKRCLLLGLEGDADLTRDGYITGTELGLYLHDKVIQNTSRAQHPQYGKIRTPELARGDFIFRLVSSGVVIEEPAPIPSKAYLSVESNVSGAKVLVDDRYIGKTNLSGIKISSGDHKVRVEKDGYESYSKRVRFKSGRSVSLTVFLDPKTPPKSNLYVDTHPKDARVRILNIGPKFYQGIVLDAGRYHVEVSANGYETKKLWVTLGSGEDRSIDVKLIKRVVTPSSSYSSAKGIKRDGRFIAYDNGIVYDKNTNLEWYAGPDKDTHWYNAKKWAESLNVAGGSWRMPTRQELKTLYKKGAGKRNMTPLLKTIGWWVWSGETKGSSQAWLFVFYNGTESWDSIWNFSKPIRGFAVRSRRYPKHASISPEVLRPKVVGRDGRFIAYDNGTVKDTKTGLMWASKDNGEDITWKGAKWYCKWYRGGGYSDWRMPTQDELVGLYDKNSYGYNQDCGEYSKVKLTNLIHITCCCLWASNSYAHDSVAANFHFSDGTRYWFSQSGSINLRVLLVRDDN